MPRAGLTRDAVLDAAADLADKDGLAAVSLSALAARFGVRPPSLYKHVAGLDDILAGLALRSVREANERVAAATVGLSGAEAVVALARAYFEYGRARPGLYAAGIRAPSPDDKELAAAADRLLGTVLAALRGFRLGKDDALHAARGLRAIVHGFLSLDAAGGFGLPLDVEESFMRLARGFAHGLAGDPAAE